MKSCWPGVQRREGNSGAEGIHQRDVELLYWAGRKVKLMVRIPLVIPV